MHAKKEDSQNNVYFNRLTNGFSKDWQHYQHKFGAGNPVAEDSCYLDDIWRFSIDGALRIDKKGTICTGDDTAAILTANWQLNDASDTLILDILSSGVSVIKKYKIGEINENDFIVVSMKDSLGTLKEYRDYFRGW